MINKDYKPHFHFDRRAGYLGSFGGNSKKRYRSKPFTGPRLSEAYKDLLESFKKEKHNNLKKSRENHRNLYYLVKELFETVGRDAMPKSIELINNQTNLAHTIAKNNWLTGPFSKPKPDRIKIYMQAIEDFIKEYKETFKKAQARDIYGFPIREENNGPEAA